jgi:acetyl esterase
VVLPIWLALACAAFGDGDVGGARAEAAVHPDCKPVPAVPAAGGGFAVAVQRDLRYRVVGGRTLRLDACVPLELRPCPRAGVVFVHGGAWRAGEKGWYAREGQLVASLGWVGFAIDYRLAPAAPFPAAVDDTFAAVRWIRSHAWRFQLDPNRLAIFGGSAGGNLAALVAADPTRDGSKPLVRVGVAWSGLYDLRQLTLTDPHGLGEVAKTYIGCSLQQCAGRYRRASPTSFVGARSVPLFVANGRRELVPVSQPLEMARILDEAHVPHELQIVPGRGHDGANFDAAWPRSIAFLERYLGPTPAHVATTRAGRSSGKNIDRRLVAAVIVAALALLLFGRSRKAVH